MNVNRKAIGFGALGVALGVALAYVAGAHMHHIAHDAPFEAKIPIVLALVAGALGVGGPIVALLWTTRDRLGPLLQRFAGPTAVGAVSGAVALVGAQLLERVYQNSFGKYWGSGQGSNILAAATEEITKLLIPVLLAIFVARYREPIIGFWTVLCSAALFGWLEGAGYMVVGAAPVLEGTQSNPSDGISEGAILSLDVVIRAIADFGHPLYTGGAAAVIWLAIAKFSGGKVVGVGLLGLLGAIVLHALDDGVIGFYIHNGLIQAVVIAVYLGLVYHFWYSKRLNTLIDYVRD